jgi:hypothetical protein
MRKKQMRKKQMVMAERTALEMKGNNRGHMAKGEGARTNTRVQAAKAESARRHTRGQVAIEFLAVVSFFLLISVPLFLFFYSSAPQKEYFASLSQAESSADQLVKYGELVFTQGNGTNVTKLVVLPKHVTNLTFNGSHVALHVESMGLQTDVVRSGPVNFAPAQYPISDGGSYQFTFTNLNGNVYVTKS